MTEYNLTVKAVVDVVNNVIGLWGKGGESAFVLLEQVLLGSRKSWDVVQVTNALVWSVGDDLSGNGGVKSGHLQVDTDIGVVDVDNIGSTQVANRLIITHGIGSGSESGHTGKGSGLAQELAALGSKLSGRSLNLVAGSKGGNSAVNEAKDVNVRFEILGRQHKFGTLGKNTGSRFIASNRIDTPSGGTSSTCRIQNTTALTPKAVLVYDRSQEKISAPHTPTSLDLRLYLFIRSQASCNLRNKGGKDSDLHGDRL